MTHVTAPANDDLAACDVAAFRARNAAQLAAGVAAFKARQAEAEAQIKARRDKDAAAKRAKTGGKKRLSRIHPLKLTPREAALLKLLMAKPRTVEELSAELGVKRSGRIYLLRSLTRKLADVGGITCGYAVNDPAAIRAVLEAVP